MIQGYIGILWIREFSFAPVGFVPVGVPPYHRPWKIPLNLPNKSIWDPEAKGT